MPNLHEMSVLELLRVAQDEGLCVASAWPASTTTASGEPRSLASGLFISMNLDFCEDRFDEKVMRADEIGRAFRAGLLWEREEASRLNEAFDIQRETRDSAPSTRLGRTPPKRV